MTRSLSCFNYYRSSGWGLLDRLFPEVESLSICRQLLRESFRAFLNFDRQSEFLGNFGRLFLPSWDKDRKLGCLLSGDELGTGEEEG